MQKSAKGYNSARYIFWFYSMCNYTVVEKLTRSNNNIGWPPLPTCGNSDYINDHIQSSSIRIISGAHEHKPLHYSMK